MKKYLLLLTLLIIPITYADLVINPNPMSIELKRGENISFEATITNNYNFKILDFDFGNLTGFAFPDIILEANESKTITFYVKRSEAGSFSETTPVSFKYLVDLPEGHTEHHVNITQYGYDPDRIVVRQGDTVIWTNNDQITRTVTSGYFDSELQPNQQFSWNFNDIETVIYNDLILYYGGEVVIINASEESKVNDPSYDITWNFNIEVALDPTDLYANTTETNYSVGATGSVEGLLEIINRGSIEAQKVTLTADPEWIKFDENAFNLANGEKNYVTYHVEPKVFETDATNKTYTIAVRIKGTNTNQTTLTLHVFVPYSNIFDDIKTNEGFLQYYARFCSENPNLFICNPNANNESKTEIIITDPQIPVNMSEREVLATLKRIQRIEDSNARTNNELKKLSDQYGKDLPVILDIMNKSVSMQEENERSSTSKQRAFWWALFFIIICSIILAVALLTKKLRTKKNIAEGEFELYG